MILLRKSRLVKTTRSYLQCVFYTHTRARSAVQTSRSEGGLFLHLHLLLSGACRHVVVDAFIMVVNSHCQNLLGMVLAHNILIQISKNLRENKNRLYTKLETTS